MARKQKYTIEELVTIYRKYASLKGWSTNEYTVRENVDGWVNSSIGPVGLAIEFHENRTDGAKHLGFNAEEHAIGAPIQHINVILVGTEYPNSDGSCRRTIAGQCTPLEQLILEHEPRNKYDSNAIAILRSNRQQLGYLSRKVAAETQSRIKQGFKHAAVIKEVKASNKMKIDISRAMTPDAIEIVIVLFIVKTDVSALEWQNYYSKWEIDSQQSFIKQ